MDNCPEFLFAWFALSRLGAVAVTTNTGSSAEELNYFISDSRSCAVLTQPKYEIETVINRVAGVVESAVIGRPDDMLDEVPVAFVVARAPSVGLEAEIMGVCEQALSRFKRPRQIFFVDALPKGLLDKTLKKNLRVLLHQMK
jgi:acyl-coenzyme A synthetase/AMP-(fatty) acid ligase